MKPSNFGNKFLPCSSNVNPFWTSNNHRWIPDRWLNNYNSNLNNPYGFKKGCGYTAEPVPLGYCSPAEPCPFSYVDWIMICLHNSKLKRAARTSNSHLIPSNLKSNNTNVYIGLTYCPISGPVEGIYMRSFAMKRQQIFLS